MTYKVGFTGTQYGMTLYQKDEIRFILTRLAILHGVGCLEFHHGNCIGSDEQSAQIAKELGFHIVSHPPTDIKKMSNFVSDETRTPKQYLARNKDIVDECNELIATTRTTEEQLRSGTWSTVRYAKRKNKPYIVIPPRDWALPR